MVTVTSRKGRVSRNENGVVSGQKINVTSRKGRVSRNWSESTIHGIPLVTSRKGRVSRNQNIEYILLPSFRHVPQGACE